MSIEEKNDEIELLPDPERVMNGLRDTGYDFNTAVADIVDNSIAANATKIEILIQLDPARKITVYFADNGIGMNQKELINAMKYGSDRRVDPSSLGKFGLGLKTASTAFCKCLSVISRGKDDSNVRKVQWDLEYISQIKKWKLLCPNPNDDELELLDSVAENGSGTLVSWTKVDRLIRNYSRPRDAENALNRIVNSLESHLALTYENFISSQNKNARDIEIKLNGNKIQAWDPFCKSESELLLDDEISIGIDEETETGLVIKAYLLPRKDEFKSQELAQKARISNEMQGFYVFRENRLIHYGDWMGMYSNEPHGSLLRVNLSFTHELDDAFNVDIKKSRILLDDAIFIKIKEMIAPLRRAADEKYRKGTRKDVAAAGADAHEASNRNIENKAASVENAKIVITDEAQSEIQITNPQGTFKHKITIISQLAKPGQYRVIPVESLDDGILWNPCISEGKLAVEINQGHPYYQKIYYPVLKQNVMVTGMDALLWALSEAELSTMNDNTKEQYEDMRYEVSRNLKKLIVDLPEPETNSEE